MNIISSSYGLINILKGNRKLSILTKKEEVTGLSAPKLEIEETGLRAGKIRVGKSAAGAIATIPFLPMGNS